MLEIELASKAKLDEMGRKVEEIISDNSSLHSVLETKASLSDLETKADKIALDSKANLTDLEKKIDKEQMQELENRFDSLVNEVAIIDKLREQNDLQNKEIAYLKLKQDAADRIEGGTTFADDIQGNNFGITFNEELSENAVIRNGGLTMNEGAMVENNVNDSVVISGSYITSGNGGRKLVRLDNGTLVCVFRTSSSYYLYKSVDNGRNWIKLTEVPFALQDISITTDGTYIHVLLAYVNEKILFISFKEDGRAISANTTIQSFQTALGTCSLAINEEGTELHACWSSKNSTYPNSFNIQYCKGVIGEGGTVTWGSVEQVTTYNNNSIPVNFSSPSIILNKDNTPVIICGGQGVLGNGSLGGNPGRYSLVCFVRNSGGGAYYNTNWSVRSVYEIISGGYQQGYPSAIFVPKSVNGLENGRIWVAWQGMDSIDTTTNIRISYSDDGGVTWSTMEKLTSGSKYAQYTPSITANTDNEIFVTWNGYTSTSPSYYVVCQIKWKDGNWGEIENKQLEGYHLTNTAALYDVKWQTNSTKPLFVYTINGKSINFTGSWKVGGYTPTTSATAVYNLPSTDYVGLFVQKEGNVNITATVNDTPMDAVLDGNEYQFTKALDSEAPVTLKLSLSRENTTNGNNDKLTRILGGIS